MTARSWSELPRWQQVATAVLAPIEVALTTVAMIDLARRPSRQIRGPKALWWPLVLVQPVGPVAYLVWARHRPDAPEDHPGLN
jgi:hypothetical protein